MSSYFPIQTSTLSSHALAEHVADAYNLASPVRCRLFNQTLNDMYLVEADGKTYVYRVWAQAAASPFQLDAVLEVQHRLASRDLPVVVPIRRPSGVFVQTLSAPEGERATALFSFAPGQPAGRGISADQSFTTGRLAATTHLAADTFGDAANVPAHDVHSLLLEPLEAIRQGEAAVHQAASFEKSVESLARHLSKLETSTPLFGLCHGDIHGMNVLFDEGKPTLLDFDRLSYGWRAWDLAVFVWWIRGVVKESEVERAFLDGYRSGHPLAERIIEAVPLFVPIRHLLLTRDIITYAQQGLNVGRWIDEALSTRDSVLSEGGWRKTTFSPDSRGCS